MTGVLDGPFAQDLICRKQIDNLDRFSVGVRFILLDKLEFVDKNHQEITSVSGTDMFTSLPTGHSMQNNSLEA